MVTMVPNETKHTLVKAGSKKAMAKQLVYGVLLGGGFGKCALRSPTSSRCTTPRCSDTGSSGAAASTSAALRLPNFKPRYYAARALRITLAVANSGAYALEIWIHAQLSTARCA